MFTFFGKNYSSLRNDKIKLYEKVKIHQLNSKEKDPRYWPVRHYYPFHSFPEFGLQFVGIFLKPILCFGELLFSLMKTTWNFIEAVAYLVFLWDLSSSIKELGNSLYETANVFYMILSIIFDPLLALISFSLRSINSLLYGFTQIFNDEIIIEPTTPNIGSFGDITEVTKRNYITETPDPDDGLKKISPFKRNPSSLQTITLSGILEDDVTWYNSPVF